MWRNITLLWWVDDMMIIQVSSLWRVFILQQNANCVRMNEWMKICIVIHKDSITLYCMFVQ